MYGRVGIVIDVRPREDLKDAWYYQVSWDFVTKDGLVSSIESMCKLDEIKKISADEYDRRRGREGGVMEKDFDVHILLPLSTAPSYQIKIRTGGKELRPRRRCDVCKTITSYFCKRCSDICNNRFVAICCPFDAHQKSCYWKHINAPLIITDEEMVDMAPAFCCSPIAVKAKQRPSLPIGGVSPPKRELESPIDLSDSPSEKRVSPLQSIKKMLKSPPIALSPERKKVMRDVFTSLAQEMDKDNTVRPQYF